MRLRDVCEHYQRQEKALRRDIEGTGEAACFPFAFHLYRCLNIRTRASRFFFTSQINGNSFCERNVGTLSGNKKTILTKNFVRKLK